MNLPDPPTVLSAEQVELFAKLSDAVVRRRLTVPAVIFLESVRPLNYIGSQVMVFFSPFAHALFETRQYDLVRQALENRETLGYLCDLLEAKETAQNEQERAQKAAQKAARTSHKPPRKWFK